MLKDKISLTTKAIVALVVGLVLYILFLYLFTDVEAIIAAFQHTNPAYYALAFFANLLHMLFQSLTWWRLLQSLSIRTDLRKALSFMWIGRFVDILVPAESISGEVTRVYLMSKGLGESGGGRITASTMIQRVINTSTSLVGFIIGATLFTLGNHVPHTLLALMIIIMGGAIASLCFLVLLCTKRKIAWKILDSLFRLFDFVLRGRWRLTTIKPRIQRALDAFFEGIKTFKKQPEALLGPLAFSVLAWFSKILIIVFVFSSLSIEAGLSSIIVVFSLSDTLQTVPLGIPGEVGVMDIVMTGLYMMVNIPLNLSATATILTRAVTMWFNLLVGGMMVNFMRLNQKNHRTTIINQTTD